MSDQLNVAYAGSSVIMQLQAQTVAQGLLSPGSPLGWSSQINLTEPGSWINESVSVGLGTGKTGNLSSQKIYTLISMASTNYQATKEVLGISYDYDILIRSGAVNVSIGEPPGQFAAKTIYVQKENVIVNGVPGVLTVLIWTNTPLGTT